MSVTLIYGAPCAGKTTEALRRMQPGDLLIDYDRLHQALDPSESEDTADLAAQVWVDAQRRARRHPSDVWLTKVHPDHLHIDIDWAVRVDAPHEILEHRIATLRPARWAEYLADWMATPGGWFDPDEVVQGWVGESGSLEG